MLTLWLDCDSDNAAFKDDAPKEVARILHDLATRLFSGRELRGKFALFDINGNKVGEANFTER